LLTAVLLPPATGRIELGLKKTHSKGINRLSRVSQWMHIIAHRDRGTFVAELPLENMHRHPRLGEVGGMTVPEIVQPDVRQAGPLGGAGEVAPVEVSGVERPAVGLAEDQALIMVAIPEAGPPPFLFLTMVGQGIGEELGNGHGIMPVGFGGAPDLVASEAVEFLPENDLPDDQVDRRPPESQRLAGASSR
jgi:hypothetical protein